MKLVADWRDWRRWYSMRWIILTTATAAIIAAYNTLPADWLPEIAPWMKKALGYVTLGSAGAAGISRVTQQKNLGRRSTDDHPESRCDSAPTLLPPHTDPTDGH